MDIQSEINSNHVLSQVHELLINQTKKGLEKYGRTVRPSELSTGEWLDHASEEIIDLLVYLQVLKQKQSHDEKVKKQLKRYYDGLDKEGTQGDHLIADGITTALTILNIKIKGIND